MTHTIDVRPQDLEIILKILRTYFSSKTKVWVFGSRAAHKAKPYSDLDLAIDDDHQAISLSLYAALTSDFEESDLPYKVDVIDYTSISDSFRACIDGERVLLEL